MPRKPLVVLLVAPLLLIMLGGCLNLAIKGTEKARAQAELRAWELLARRGDVEAQYNLGKAYCCDDRPFHDRVKALYWYCQAAKAGQRDALYEVGEIYKRATQFEGEIIPYDPVLALVYYTLADQKGHEKAAASRDCIAGTLTDLEKERAAVLLAAWPDTSCEIYRRGGP